MTAASSPLLAVDGLRKHFPAARGGVVKALEDVSFTVPRRKIVGLVGESGSGKTTAGRCVLRLIEPTAGRVEFDGVELAGLRPRDMLALRRRMQIVFQDPFSSLNPRMTIAGILGEALDTHKLAKGAARRARIGELLELVGLHPDHARRYPHEFSGGQRQRIGIARALAVEPEFLVADEPVSALDVSVQAQVLNLLQELQKSLDLSMLFISHDLTVVEYLCDDMVVMYLGRVMERGPSRTIYARPRHPYTKALLATAPIPDPKARRERVALLGDIPSPLNPPSGCVFRTRCPSAVAACAETVPPLLEVDGRWVACIRDGELNGPTAEPAVLVEATEAPRRPHP